ncbi:ATP-binding SpoIIE family protein phosphatase [Filimonas effusa]|uniref:Serine/threonine protein kinase n=1 Tax=Filimonas effusa TaxID=2508721 RepID=A0A4Q1D3D7_9BACT|nr:ATP-binding SpoIIE family protein phosphatase [Filimonas effusa]RXK82808.1 serine/threonine protein kinase [Filimonas effusa]
MARMHHQFFNVADRSYLAIIKKDIHSLAVQLPFSSNQLAEIDIIVAELTSNLIKYAKEGQLLVKLIDEDDRQGIEILSIDQGPGMSDVSRMQEDGVSTGTSLGQGLGAIKRLSHEFQVYSVKGWGTIVLTRVWTKAPSFIKPRKLFEVQSVVVPKPGETGCGDGMAYKKTGNHLLIFSGDALGHGEDAGEVMEKAVKAFHDSPETSPAATLRFMHTEVRKTRGLVACVASFSFREKKWTIAGVGNISIRSGNFEFSKGYFSYNGIVGLNIPGSMKDQEIICEPHQRLVFCSDGLKSRWELPKLAGIYKYDPIILAAALYKDYARNTDDMSVIVGKINVS